MPQCSPLEASEATRVHFDVSTCDIEAASALAQVRRPAPAPSATFFDGFAGSSLASGWQVLHPELVLLTLSGGELHLVPTQPGPNATWFEDGEGPLVWRSVTGDFTATARVRVDSLTTPGAPPPTDYRLAGLLVRDPNSAPNQRGSAHVALGAGTAATPIAWEDKTTLASHSDFVLYNAASSSAELRIVRRGSQIELLARAVGAPNWTLLRAHAHPEFPASVQVGLMIYSFSAPVDIRAHVDWIAIEG